MAATTIHPAIQRYLTALEASLRKAPGASPADGLADAHEFLQSEWDAVADRQPPLDDELFEHFVQKFGTPDEVAAAYAATCEPLSDAVVLSGAAARSELAAPAARGQQRWVRVVAVGAALAILLAAAAVTWRSGLKPADGTALGTGDRGLMWADRVVSFQPGNPPSPSSADPLAALGPPDCHDGNREPQTYVTLGHKGQLVLEFTGVELYDGEGPDLLVVEIGPLAEAVEVSVSSDGQQWVAIGRSEGAGATLDLRDRVLPGDRFRFVRLVDLGTMSKTKNQWPGADIDAVGAIHAHPLR
jgi:hypothetical protein